MPFLCKGICDKHRREPLKIYYCSSCSEYLQESGTKRVLGIRRCLCCGNKVRTKPHHYGKRRD